MTVFYKPEVIAFSWSPLATQRCRALLESPTRSQVLLLQLRHSQSPRPVVVWGFVWFYGGFTSIFLEFDVILVGLHENSA